MNDNALQRYCLTFCLCLVPVIGGCSDPHAGCTPRIELSASEVLTVYQRSLSQENLGGIPDLVDEEVRDQCLELSEAYTRYDKAGRRLAELVRSQYGEELAESFMSGTFATFSCVAIQSLFFACSEEDIPIYAGSVELVPRSEGLLLTVDDTQTDLFLRKCGSSWKVSRLSGNADWRRSMRTAGKQLDALSERFDCIAINIEGPDRLSESQVSSLLMLRCEPSREVP